MARDILPATNVTGEADGVVGGLQQSSGITQQALAISGALRIAFRQHSDALATLEQSAFGMGLTEQAKVQRNTMAAEEILATGEGDLIAAMALLVTQMGVAETEFRRHLDFLEHRAVTGQIPHDSACQGN